MSTGYEQLSYPQFNQSLSICFKWLQRDSNLQPLSSSMNTQPFSQTGLNDWVVLWLLNCMVQLTVWSHYVTYAFHSESILHSCLNVKELLARNRRDIWIFKWLQLGLNPQLLSLFKWLRPDSNSQPISSFTWLQRTGFEPTTYELSGCGFESHAVT